MNITNSRLREPRSLSVRRIGSALLEVLLAVLIFGIAALALSRALNSVALLAIQSKQAGQIQAEVHSLLFEYGFGVELVEGETEIPSNDELVAYRLVIEPVEMENMEGLVLPDMFKITINADWQESGQPQHFSAKTLCYAPLYK